MHSQRLWAGLPLLSSPYRTHSMSTPDVHSINPQASFSIPSGLFTPPLCYTPGHPSTSLFCFSTICPLDMCFLSHLLPADVEALVLLTLGIHSPLAPPLCSLIVADCHGHIHTAPPPRTCAPNPRASFLGDWPEVRVWGYSFHNP